VGLQGQRQEVLFCISGHRPGQKGMGPQGLRSALHPHQRGAVSGPQETQARTERSQQVGLPDNLRDRAQKQPYPGLPRDPDRHGGNALLDLSIGTNPGNMMIYIRT